jgi:TRAP-type uncharacterized transport system substrate-binding protein
LAAVQNNKLVQATERAAAPIVLDQLKSGTKPTMASILAAAGTAPSAMAATDAETAPAAGASSVDLTRIATNAIAAGVLPRPATVRRDYHSSSADG